jgi:hypothetical protein
MAMSAFACAGPKTQVCQYFTAKIDARVYLSTWFCGADYRLIRRENVADLIAYGFWYKSRWGPGRQGREGARAKRMGRFCTHPIT